MSVRQCAEALGYKSHKSVQRLLQKYGIQARPPFPRGYEASEAVKEEAVRELYITRGLSAEKCAEILGIGSKKPFLRLLRKYKLPIRRCGTQRGYIWNQETLEGYRQKREKSRIRKSFLCTQCGVEKMRHPNRINEGNNFCSYICSWKWKSENIRGEKANTWNGGMRIIPCLLCGKDSTKTPNQVKERNFCSRDCAGAYKKNGTEVACEGCGVLIYRKSSRVELYGKHFCGRSCFGEWKSRTECGENHPNWQGGISFEPYPTTWTFCLREMIRERDGRVCQICGAKENGRRLVVHHIDYHKENCFPSNLISLCLLCHSRTNAYRDQWQSFFTDLMNGIAHNEAIMGLLRNLPIKGRSSGDLLRIVNALSFRMDTKKAVWTFNQDIEPQLIKMVQATA
jgi:hypothetical protein